MSQDKENIQAKLAEYVEGTLDAAGRAEIEQHLQANSEHRRLMADLLEAKATIASLPRERAPGDLIEVLQGQLERAVLLEGDLDNADHLRLRRWPQVLAIAAILALAVGLGLVVYVTLPPQHPSGFTIVEREVPMDMGVAPPVAERTETEVQDVPAIASGEADRMRQAARQTPPTVEAGPETARSQPAANSLASLLPFGVGERMAQSIAPDDEVVVVMAGADPRFADDRVVALFAQQNLQWERIGQPSVTAATPVPGPTATPDTAVVMSEPSARRDVAASSTAEGRAVGGDLRRSTVPGAAEAPASITPPVGAPDTDTDRPARQFAGDYANGYVDKQASASPAIVQAQNGYIVRGLTRQQAAELLRSLSTEGSLRMQQVYNWYGAPDVVTNAAPADQVALGQVIEDARQPEYQRGAREAAPADGHVDLQQQPLPRIDGQQAQETNQPGLSDAVATPIASGETLEIVVDQLVGPGVTPAVQQQVDPQGRVKLQMIPEPVQAEGLTPRELEQQIADHYRDADLIDAPIVHVRRAGDGAQAADAEQRVDLLIVVQNAPPIPADSSVTAPDAAAETQPAAPPAQPAQQE